MKVNDYFYIKTNKASFYFVAASDINLSCNLVLIEIEYTNTQILYYKYRKPAVEK